MNSTLLLLVLIAGLICTVSGFDSTRTKEVISDKLQRLSQTYNQINGGRVNNVQQSTGCMVCEFLVGELIYQLNSNKTSTEFFPWLENKICNALFPPTEIQKGVTGIQKVVTLYCKKLLDLALKEIVKVVDSTVQPVTVCTDLKLCQSQSDENTTKLVV